MRLLAASGIFHPEPGGPSTYLHAFLPEVLQRGHSVSVLTFGEPASESYPYPVQRISRRAAYPIRQWRYQQAARRLWAAHDLVYVHSMGVPLPRGMHPRIAKIVGDQAWERAVNRGWVPPTTDIDAFQTMEVRHPMLQLTCQVRTRRAQSFDHTIVPSEYLRRMVVGWGVPQERVSVVYNALPPNRARTALTQREARERLGLPEGPLLLTAARLTAWKYVDIVIEAVARLPDVRLLVAGDGPMLPTLRAQVERLNLGGRVRLLGRIPGEQMPLYYRAADYTVLYSGYEGLSHTLLESLHNGTPVIASDKGGNPEVVTQGTNGILAAYHTENQVSALGEALREALTPGQREQLAAGISLERFQWGTLVERTMTILEGAIT